VLVYIEHRFVYDSNRTEYLFASNKICFFKDEFLVLTENFDIIVLCVEGHELVENLGYQSVHFLLYLLTGFPTWVGA